MITSYYRYRFSRKPLFVASAQQQTTVHYYTRLGEVPNRPRSSFSWHPAMFGVTSEWLHRKVRREFSLLNWGTNVLRWRVPEPSSICSFPAFLHPPSTFLLSQALGLEVIRVSGKSWRMVVFHLPSTMHLFAVEVGPHPLFYEINSWGNSTFKHTESLPSHPVSFSLPLYFVLHFQTTFLPKELGWAQIQFFNPSIHLLLRSMTSTHIKSLGHIKCWNV